MLILNRRKGESIIVGDNIKITVGELSRDKVALAIDAPREVPVDREEIRKLKEQK